MSVINVKYLFIGALALLLGGCGGEDSGGPSQSNGGDAPATIQAVQVLPESGHIPIGFEQQMVAQVVMSDGTVTDVTNVTWSSSDTNIATIDSKGLATGVAVGNTTITASGSVNGRTVSATATLTVTNATVTSLQVTPVTASVPLGLEQQYTATAKLSDGSVRDVTTLSKLTWSSSDNAIATISNVANTKGLAKAISVGNSTITASGSTNGQTFSATATLTVTNVTVIDLQVTPDNASVPLGVKQQYTATAKLSDGSVRNVTTFSGLTWSSSDNAIATISNVDSSKGLATPVAVGGTTITATGTVNGQTFTAPATLTVTNAVLIELQVTASSDTVGIGQTLPLTATGLFSDGSEADVTTSVSWTSSGNAFATVSNEDGSQGVVQGISQGNVAITATSNDGQAISDSILLGVVPVPVLTSLLVTANSDTVGIGQALPLTATGLFSDGSSADVTTSVSWTSSGDAIATVSNEAGFQGVVQGISQGNVAITATSNDGQAISGSILLGVVPVPVLTSLLVTANSDTVGIGQTLPLTATGSFSDGSSADVTASVTWTSSSDNIATVSNATGSQGVVTGVSQGNVAINATSNDGQAISDSIILGVSP